MEWSKQHSASTKLQGSPFCQTHQSENGKCGCSAAGPRQRKCGGYRLLCHELLECRQNTAHNCCWGYTFLLITLIENFSLWRKQCIPQKDHVSPYSKVFVQDPMDKVQSNWLDNRLPEDPSNLSYVVIDNKFCSPKPCSLVRMCRLLQHPSFTSHRSSPHLPTLCCATNSPVHFKSLTQNIWEKHKLWYTDITFWKKTGPSMQAQEKLDKGTCFLRLCLLSGAKLQQLSPQSWLWLLRILLYRVGEDLPFPDSGCSWSSLQKGGLSGCQQPQPALGLQQVQLTQTPSPTPLIPNQSCWGRGILLQNSKYF